MPRPVVRPLTDPEENTVLTQYHSYDPAVGHGLARDPVKAIIAPRPIGWISTVDRQGRANLAPYSFFNIFNSRPPILIFASEGKKHSLTNIEATGEFVFNLATHALGPQMKQTSAPYEQGEDEFEKAGLQKAPSDIVAAPRVAASPAAMECKLIELKPLVDLEGDATGSILVIGQAVRIHIDPDCLVDGFFDMTRAGTIARCGYRNDYAKVSEVFGLPGL